MKQKIKVLTKKINNQFCNPILLVSAFILLCSHNLYIKFDGYFLQPNQQATLSLYNGTFEKSENIITRDRIQDASIIAKGKRVAIKADQWKDQDSTITKLTFDTGEPGTYVAGVSTKARNIELTADKFNNYLKHDGVLDMLEYRTNNNLLDQNAVESYQKHVKAIYQVGDIKTEDWKTILGYPIEFVPQANPYEKYSGDKIAIKLLLDGKPLSNQLVYADYIKNAHNHQKSHSHGPHEKEHSHELKNDRMDHSHSNSHTHKSKPEEKHTHTKKEHSHEHDEKKHSHSHNEDTKRHSHSHKSKTGKSPTHTEKEHNHEGDEKKHTHKHENDGKKHGHIHTSNTETEKEQVHTHASGQQLKTNDQGIVLVDLPEDGIYYLRTIHMVNITDSDELTHKSKWATLTFEVSHKHDESTHMHDDHNHEEEVPTWMFILGSILIIGLLFLIFRKRA
ncbi:DUF4198 domain-containing protein [Aquimarina litoralis]|uniref:DUF4198 domain-containing protein n=1 Tax=Aquimarina litoralis TaxID=584605 RepID=UPI001C589857|nr:DUF4198 domain-containing protein [Aquimarina litoralis]MBW1294791.1 DUF4198 domain-containing protein [Aquimarina litoralis]